MSCSVCALLSAYPPLSRSFFILVIAVPIKVPIIGGSHHAVDADDFGLHGERHLFGVCCGNPRVCPGRKAGHTRECEDVHCRWPLCGRHVRLRRNATLSVDWCCGAYRGGTSVPPLPFFIFMVVG